MTSLADGLPPELAHQVHPDWYKNEKAYWSVRNGLLDRYKGQWVAFADDAVIASGSSAVDVLMTGQASGKHPFIIRVGHEDEPSRIRRVSFPYDKGYGGEALPVLEVEFRPASGAPGVMFNQVIPDTGSDTSLVPWVDFQRLQGGATVATPSMVQGVGGTPMQTLVLGLWVSLDNREFACRLHADFDGDERILGREVLNRLEILFRGPAGEVVVNP
jgi:hypothetical protein